jgi:alpha-galactosidase
MTMMKYLKRMHFCISIGVSLFVISSIYAEDRPLALKPPMGWNSWNHFNVNITDKIIREQADAMVSSGMRDMGYIYINIDDSWEGGRDDKGEIHPNSKFPDMKRLADYVHSKGLKLGIYSSPGSKTCGGYEGSYGHEVQDANTYARWGIDYLKYDLCSLGDLMKASPTHETATEIMKSAYLKMHNALVATGRPIVFSLCQYGKDSVWSWGTTVGGNLWRTGGDIDDKFPSMIGIALRQAGLGKFAGPGHWNDPDMLEIGNGGMKDFEYKTHMTLWAILAAPLIAGNDLTVMSPSTKAILMNKEVIEIDQDEAGKQGDRLYAEGPVEVWSRDLVDGSKAVAIFNLAESVLTIPLDISKIGFKGPIKARDLWEHKDLGVLSPDYSVKLFHHSCQLLKVWQ